MEMTVLEYSLSFSNPDDFLCHASFCIETTVFTVVKLSGLVSVWVNTMCACFAFYAMYYSEKRPQCVVVCARAKVI